ncbi:hypothetical protein KR093_009073, partial [Drosophila rubida]
ILFVAHLLLGTGYLQSNKMRLLTQQEQLAQDMRAHEAEPRHMSLVTRPAPHFEGTAVINKALVPLSLSQFAGKYVVLLFYALDFSSVCPKEVTEYSERIDEFRKLNAVVIACSVDSAYSHMTWLDMPRKASGLGNVRIPLLSDITHKISEDYGIYLPEFGHSLRAQFIIDSKGIVRQATINDLFVSRSVDETLRLIQGCRYADLTGTSCPS